MTVRRTMWVLGAAALACLGAGCSPIVGGSCRPGTVVCAGRCVDLASDDGACGACDVACGLGEHCVAGACAIVGDADVPDAAVPDARDPVADAGTADDAAMGPPDADAATGDGGVPVDGPPGPPSDGGGSDGGPDDLPPCDLGELECAGVCVAVSSNPGACGACDVACGAAQLCERGVCVDVCGDGLARCGRACVSLADDPDHCGACGRSCPSGICEAGVCAGRLAGHVVLIGHDYTTARAAMERVLGNAVLLSVAGTIDVLSWRGGATPESIDGTERAIRSVAAAMSRTVSIAPAPDADAVTRALADAEVFLVHAQASGTDAELEALGARWSVALETFLERGGVVVSLETMAPNAGTWTILRGAGLVDASRTEEATGELVSVVAPADALAIGVPLSYRGERLSVRLLGADLPVVASDAVGAIVLHRTVVGP